MNNTMLALIIMFAIMVLAIGLSINLNQIETKIDKCFAIEQPIGDE